MRVCVPERNRASLSMEVNQRREGGQRSSGRADE